MRLEAFSVMLNVEVAKVDLCGSHLPSEFHKRENKKGILKLVNLNDIHFFWHLKGGFLRKIYLADSLRRMVVGSSG